MAIRNRAWTAFIPVSCETLATRQTAMEYFECLGQIPSDVRNCIMPMLCHCPMGVPEGRLAELVNPLKRLTRAVSMRLESRKQPLTAIKAAGAYSVSFDLSELAGKDQIGRASCRERVCQYV